MDTDLLFVLGLGLRILALPAIVSALIDGRAPRTPGYLVIIGGLMIGYAVMQSPNGYSLETLPDVIGRVIDRYTN